MMNMLMTIDSFDGNLPEPEVKEPYEKVDWFTIVITYSSIC